MRTVEDRFWTKVDRRFAVGACWLWDGSTGSSGYGQVQHNGRVQAAHRVSYELFVGPIPKGMFILHQCDVKKCVRPDHLRIGTREENAREAVDRGRMATGDRSSARLHPERVPRGERQHKAKLTADAVRIIRAEYAVGITQRELAKRYGISSSVISEIITGKAWAHVPATEKAARLLDEALA